MNLWEGKEMRFSFRTLHFSYAPYEINCKNIFIICSDLLEFLLFAAI